MRKQTVLATITITCLVKDARRVMVVTTICARRAFVLEVKSADSLLVGRHGSGTGLSFAFALSASAGFPLRGPAS